MMISDRRRCFGYRARASSGGVVAIQPSGNGWIVLQFLLNTWLRPRAQFHGAAKLGSKSPGASPAVKV